MSLSFIERVPECRSFAPLTLQSESITTISEMRIVVTMSRWDTRTTFLGERLLRSTIPDLLARGDYKYLTLD